MDLSSLNVDVLLYFMKFLRKDDAFNLLLSGILKGFENAIEGIDLRTRINDFVIDLGPCRDGTCQLEIRSLRDETPFHEQIDENRLTTLERLADAGYFRNTRLVTVKWRWPSVIRLCRVIRSMTNLEKLGLSEWELTLTEDVPQLLRSCPKLTELHMGLTNRQKLEINEDLKNELRPGYQRLKIFELECWSISWPSIQEVLTWLKECTQLTVRGFTCSTPVIDGFMALNPDLSPNLQFLHLYRVPVEFVKWMLPCCQNIHTLKLFLIDQPRDLHNEIVGLKKLKDLHIGIDNGIHPKEIIRNCRQVEILRVSSCYISLGDLAALEHYENLKEVHLRWIYDFPVKEAFKMLKRCTNLRRITLTRMKELHFPSSKELRDFIMQMKHLTYLHVIYDDIHKCGHFKSEVDEVTASILRRRPNFEFYVSCCSKFDKSRVPRREFSYC